MLLFIAVALLYALKLNLLWYAAAVLFYAGHSWIESERHNKPYVDPKAMQAIIENLHATQLAAIYTTRNDLRDELKVAVKMSVDVLKKCDEANAEVASSIRRIEYRIGGRR